MSQGRHWSCASEWMGIATMSAYVAAGNGPIILGNTSDMNMPPSTHIYKYNENMSVLSSNYHNYIIQSSARYTLLIKFSLKKAVVRTTSSRMKSVI